MITPEQANKLRRLRDQVVLCAVREKVSDKPAISLIDTAIARTPLRNLLASLDALTMSALWRLDTQGLLALAARTLGEDHE